MTEQYQDQISTNFWRHEFACRCGCGYDTVDVETLRILQAARTHFGARVTVNSGARCRSHNAAVGGTKGSQHLYGRAADVQVDGYTPDEVAAWVAEHYPEASIGIYKTFVHIDTRSDGPARWRG